MCPAASTCAVLQYFIEPPPHLGFTNVLYCNSLMFILLNSNNAWYNYNVALLFYNLFTRTRFEYACWNPIIIYRRVSELPHLINVHVYSISLNCRKYKISHSPVVYKWKVSSLLIKIWFRKDYSLYSRQRPAN